MFEYWQKYRGGAWRMVVVGALCLLAGALAWAARQASAASSSVMAESGSVAGLTANYGLPAVGAATLIVGLWLLITSRPAHAGSFVARFGAPRSGSAFDHIDRELRGAAGFVPTTPTSHTGRIFVTASWIVAARGLATDAMPWNDVTSIDRRVDPSAPPVPYGSADPSWVTITGRSGRSLSFAVPGVLAADAAVAALRTMAGGGAWTGDVAQVSAKLITPGRPERDLGVMDQMSRSQAVLMTAGYWAMVIGSIVRIGRSPIDTIFSVIMAFLFGALTVTHLLRAIRRPVPPVGVADQHNGGLAPVLIMRAGYDPRTMTSAGPPAGWYADPAGAPLQRWWDGASWTRHTT